MKGEIETLKSIVSELEKKPNAGEMKPAIDELKEKIGKLEQSASSESETQEMMKAIRTGFEEVANMMKKAISKSIPGEPGDQNVDKKVTINGEEYMVKAEHREIYKGIADVDSGKAMNILTPTNTRLFIDEVIGSKPGDTLTDISVLPMMKDETIDAGLVQDMVLTNSLDEAASAQAIATGSISCPTGILTGEFTLARDTVEFYKDKYGEEAFGAYVEQHIAKKVEKAIRLLLFKGDRDSETAKLAALDGVIAQATDDADTTDISTTTYDTWAKVFEQALLGFDDDKLEEQENFRIYVSHKNLIKIRAELAERETNAGDRLLLEGGNVSFAGIPVKPRLMDDTHVIAGLTKFIIIGYRTDAEMKVEHHGSDWKYHWYVRLRAGIAYVPDFVKVYVLTSGT